MRQKPADQLALDWMSNHASNYSN